MTRSPQPRPSTSHSPPVSPPTTPAGSRTSYVPPRTFPTTSNHGGGSRPSAAIKLPPSGSTQALTNTSLRTFPPACLPPSAEATRSPTYSRASQPTTPPYLLIRVSFTSSFNACGSSLPGP
ncbi:hypothetical protein B2J93_1398 [Marssonina coronariae]|uniref:Uncharacterized protein n=1 Tax=Diplocarpon coronariae TaxID=2795749 RepID=A0A218Z8Z6_9HELO|nr:hypothetical protein B2J93_1398 [Marssonina coronariae]